VNPKKQDIAGESVSNKRKGAKMDFPKMIRIRQKFVGPALGNVPQELTSQVDRLGLERKIRPGQTVAVVCSSRGITNHSTIVEATVRSLQRIGLKPFIIPAMGSH